MISHYFDLFYGGHMYAIIESGGKQYRVEKGDIIDVELLGNEAGEKISFDKVLFFHDGSTATVGIPHVNACKVHAELLQEVRGPKLISYKYKKRQNYRRKVGHRQNYARVKILEIKGA